MRLLKTKHQFKNKLKSWHGFMLFKPQTAGSIYNWSSIHSGYNIEDMENVSDDSYRAQ